ncbi:MAG TPA: hypothetical protein VIJ22_09790 [Polyangiaceae bacterium]
MSGIRVEGNTSGNVAEVTAANQLQVTLPEVTAQGGYAVALSEEDAGTFTGAALRRALFVTEGQRLETGRDTPLFDYDFNATAQDTGAWKCAFTTMTMTEGGGFLLLNSNSDITAAHGCSLSSFRYFNLLTNAGLNVEFVGGITLAALANQVVEFGLFLPTTTTAPADGVYFRYTSAGLIGVINYNGVETTTGPLSALTPGTISNDFQIRLDTQRVEFWLDDVLQAALILPVGNSQPYITTALPVSMQFRNSGTVAGSVMQWKMGCAHVDQKGVDISMPFPHQQVAQGLTQQGLAGGVMGSLAAYANNLAPGAGVAMTNTTAALGTGLGGQFSALPTLAANTDGVVCSYQVPAGGINQRPRILMLTGVRVQSLITTALTGGPLFWAYSLAFGHTAVSLATAESASFANATAKAPRRIALGFETIVVTAPVGTLGQGVQVTFSSPIPVNPGEFVALVAKNFGTVTTLGVNTFLVFYDYYWI